MISDDEYQRWLRNPRSERVVLHEFGDQRFANRPHIAFIEGFPYSYACATAGPLNFDAGLDAGMNVGDLDIINTGKFDYLLNQSWRGTEFISRWGAPEWEYTDYRPITRLLINDLTPVDRQRLRIRFYDPRRVLAVPVVDSDLPATTDIMTFVTALAGLAGVEVAAPKHFAEQHSAMRIKSWLSSDTSTVDQVLTDALSPLGIYHRINLAKELELIHLGYTALAEHVVTPSIIVSGSLQPQEPIQPASKIIIRWARHADGEFQTLEQLTGLDETHYEPDIFETPLTVLNDVQWELARRLRQRGVKRTPWSVEVFAPGMSIREGDRVQLIHPRFGLAAGKTGTVSRAGIRLGNTNRIALEVLI